jgi:hypothetical protein
LIYKENISRRTTYYQQLYQQKAYCMSGETANSAGAQSQASDPPTQVSKKTRICIHGPAPVFGPAWRYLLIVVGAPNSSAVTQEAQSVFGGTSRT